MLKLTGLSQITLRVNDLRRAEEFYIKSLGFKLHHRLGINMTYLSAGEDMLVLVKAETPAQSDRDFHLDHFGLRLNTNTEVDKAALDLRENGVKLLTTPANRRDGRAFFLQDPDGNVIEIYSSTGEVFAGDDTNPDEPSSRRRGRKAKVGTTKPARPAVAKRRRSRK
jgi:catechol-2,3-dioxygenase